MTKKIVVFTGAGVSAESGLGTFRGSDGMWDRYRIEDVCTHDAWLNNPQLCVEFYNMRRREALAAQPNAAHYAIARLQEVFPDTQVITQNIDNLHERAGSTRVLHLHGEVMKLRSERNPNLIVPIDTWEQKLTDTAPDGTLLRPHIVFFGESVPNFDRATEIATEADIMVVVGSSLAVYPAASLVRYVRPEVPVYLVDPNMPAGHGIRNLAEYIPLRSAEGTPILVGKLIKAFSN